MTPDLQVECPFCGCDSLTGRYGGKRLNCDSCTASAPVEVWLEFASRQALTKLPEPKIGSTEVVGFGCPGCKIVLLVDAMSETGQLKTTRCAKCGGNMERAKPEEK